MNTIEFDKKVKCGPEFVALRILDNCESLETGGILLSESAGENSRMARCVIEDVGNKAAEEYGLKAGDYVMIDRLATFAHTAPVCMCKYNNVICFTDKDGSTYFPLRNMLFVLPDNKDGATDVGNGIYIPGYDERLRTGTVVAENVDKDLNLPFGKDDKVILTKGADVVELGDFTVYNYKYDMIVCKIED